ncbi:hypothetical protein BGZ97_011692 [Linnemannia gamsii]|jgi:hypothetical protein|uniref:Uncharacterized protein n=1 Tax=Linnemannia gamsii TaxID=64522 RepID=A0A9P6UMI1_9FUNG|nr:hypothetical protein BGZ97_011692 [Linnemannia gamsii]
MVGLYLDRSELYNCVTLSKDLLCVFTPHLWKYVQILCPPRKPFRHTFRSIPTQEQRDTWFQKLKRSIEAGGLDRNGQYVQNFDCERYEAVELLAARGETCKGIKVLKLGSYPNPDVPSPKSRKFAYVPPLNLSPLILILKRNIHLRHLTLVGRMLDEKNYDFFQLLQDIPRSIVLLALKDWDPIKGKRGYNRDLRAKEYELGNNSEMDLEEQDGQVDIRFPHLKELCFSDYAIDFNKRTTEYILKNVPGLELLYLGDTYQPIPLKPLSKLLSRYCPKVVHLSLLHWTGCFDSELAELMDSGKAGWRTLDLSTVGNHRDESEFGPLSMAALLKHGPTLENVYIDCSRKFSDLECQVLFRTAPNLQRLHTYGV